MVKKLIRCTACNRVIPNYQGSDLLRAEGLPGVEWSSADLDGAWKFLRLHLGHPLEELTVKEGSQISDRPSYEPIRVTYFLADNGQREFLIRRTKSALDEPAYYEIIRGELELSSPTLKIQEQVLRRQIAAEKRFSPLLKGRMERFIQVFRDEIARISPEKFEEAVEDIDDAEGSTLACVALKNSRWERIMNRCRLYFDETELREIRGFVDDHRDPPDVLSIQIERSISVIHMGKVQPAIMVAKEMEKEEIEEAVEEQAEINVEKKAASGKF